MNNKTEKIWKEFQAKLRQFILRRVSDKDVAEDILQEYNFRFNIKVINKNKLSIRHKIYIQINEKIRRNIL